ncbi:hypothetical protein [Blastococcus sp. CCUG 61487]|uniref:hypothetical protein n=1 Tax=Blastococcus sp. CCUG 61487 TaxID=1840703 RepID=UPI0010C011EA|nr:hypothetical protein [Blastococcus sp. CCUG 61487]TKJ24337.1 hypothetical protein A6V29_04890 [Blastococcus sp. CCUG 61487]
MINDGTMQHLPADRIRRAAERFEQDAVFAEKAEEHLWIVAVAHRISPEKVAAVAAGDESALLDAESVSIAGLGCYRCEKAYEPRLLGKRCRGPQ